MTNNKTQLIISYSSIIRILFVLLVLLFLYLIRNILLLLFIAIILAAALTPFANALERRKIPRALSVISIYIIFIAFISLIIVLLVPPIVQELNQLASNLPLYYEKIKGAFSAGGVADKETLLQGAQTTLESFGANLAKTTKDVFGALVSLFGGLISLVAILVISFYMVVEKKAMRDFLKSVMPEKYQGYLTQLFSRMQEKVGLWLKGQLILCLIIGVLSFLGLTILGVNYALVLGLWAGLTEIVPFVGPLIGAIPAVFLALTQSPVKALLVVILYVIIQQVENHVIVPSVMHKAVGLNPILVIVVVLIGGKIAGIAGALIAVPLATALAVLVRDYFEIRKERAVEAGKEERFDN